MGEGWGDKWHKHNQNIPFTVFLFYFLPKFQVNIFINNIFIWCLFYSVKNKLVCQCRIYISCVFLTIKKSAHPNLAPHKSNGAAYVKRILCISDFILYHIYLYVPVCNQCHLWGYLHNASYYI